MRKLAVCLAVLAVHSWSASALADTPEIKLRGPVTTGTQSTAPASAAEAPAPSAEPLPLHDAIPADSTTSSSSTTTTSPSQVPLTGPPVLQGSAYQLKISARNLSESPLTRNHDPNLKYVEVTVKNDGPNIAVILGNAVHAKVGGEDLPAAPVTAAEMSDRPHLSGKGNLVVWAATLPTFAIAGPMVYELLTPDQHGKRNLGDAIGRDGSRQEVEATHFGVRVVIPGDETTGWFCFPCPSTAQVESLVVPISFTRSKIGAGSILVPVAQSASK